MLSPFHLRKVMQSYSVENIRLNLEKEGVFTHVDIDFSFSINFDSIVPETIDDANDFHNAVFKVVKFLNGINGSYVLETNYDNTDIFVDGTINNVSLEVPDGCSKIPMLGIILYNKIGALLGEDRLEEVRLKFTMFELEGSRVDTELVYNEDTLTGMRLKQIMDMREQEWTDALKEEKEEMEEDIKELGDQISEEMGEYAGELNEEIPDRPWWRRNDGQVRDFINIDTDLADFTNIIIHSIDLGDYEDHTALYTENDDETPPDTPDTPEPNDGDYYKF